MTRRDKTPRFSKTSFTIPTSTSIILCYLLHYYLVSYKWRFVFCTSCVTRVYGLGYIIHTSRTRVIAYTVAVYLRLCSVAVTCHRNELLQRAATNRRTKSIMYRKADSKLLSYIFYDLTGRAARRMSIPANEATVFPTTARSCESVSVNILFHPRISFILLGSRVHNIMYLHRYISFPLVVYQF